MAEHQSVSRKARPPYPAAAPVTATPNGATLSPSNAPIGASHDFTKTSVLRPQAKMTVSQPGDAHEQEAEQTAERVMRAEAPVAVDAPAPYAVASRRENEPAPGVDDVSEAVSGGLSGGGQPLPAQTRSFMEPRFGFDFSQVRVHTDARASQSADAVAARAYTVGSDIAFRQGDYQPDSSDGRKLLAHELTHVVQQGGASAGAVVNRDGNVPAPALAPTDAGAMPAAPKPMGMCYEKSVFLSLCGQANTRIDLAERASRAWMLSLALAYGDAWKNHVDRLKDQAELEKLQDDLILGAALAFVPGGFGGVIGAAMKKVTTSDFLIDGVKDLAKFGARSSANAGLPAAASVGGGGPDAGLKAFPTDPLKWQDQVDLRLTNELVVATKALDQWQTKANGNDGDFPMDFDPVAVTEGALKINGERMADLKAEDQSSLSKSFEKGFWKAWLERYGYILDMSGGTYYAKDNVGKKVKNRCEELGLPIDEYIAKAHARVDEETLAHNTATLTAPGAGPSAPMAPPGSGM